MIVQETVKEPMTFVRQMLDLKSKFDKIIMESFLNEKKMQKKLKDAFEEFVNLDARCASYLASYLDEQLKRYTLLHYTPLHLPPHLPSSQLLPPLTYPLLPSPLTPLLSIPLSLLSTL